MPWSGVAAARAIAIATCVLMVSAVTPGAVATAQSTPTAPLLDIPSPDECTVESREFPFFPAGVGQRAAATPLPLPTVPAAPFVAPEGQPADAETVAAITATVRESLACRNANDLLRAYALFSENMMVALFGGPATIDPEVRAAAVEAPNALPRKQRVALVGIEDVVVLPDGRVGAVVETQTNKQSFRDYLYFVNDAESGRWLIDDAKVMGDG